MPSNGIHMCSSRVTICPSFVGGKFLSAVYDCTKRADISRYGRCLYRDAIVVAAAVNTPSAVFFMINYVLITALALAEFRTTNNV